MGLLVGIGMWVNSVNSRLATLERHHRPVIQINAPDCPPGSELVRRIEPELVACRDLSPGG